MTSCRRLIALAVVAGFLVFLPGCHRTPPTTAGPLYIMLTYNNGTCQQNGSTGVVDVAPGQSAIYQGAAALAEFQVQFTACPFTSCPINSPNGTSVNAGPPVANAAGNTYYYSAMTINNQQCNNIGPLGLRVWPP
jgi:hypothetical protein